MDPYRLLFPLGALISILGSFAWIPFGFGLISSYPGIFHPDLMIGGFLVSFAAGFLMTAVPQFTGSIHCRAWELALATTGILGLAALGFADHRLGFHLLSTAFLAGLAAFGARRFLTRTFEPPPYFVFVGLGLIMGIAGAALQAASDSGLAGASVWLLGKGLYQQGMMLSLTLGVGTHLLPAIWGFSDLPVRITPRGQGSAKAFGPAAALAATLLASFLIDAFASPWAGSAIRAALVAYLAFFRWQIHRRPKARGRLVYWLRVSAWALVIGFALPALAPTYAVHGIHVAFIGGFGLMTLLIGARVTLVHGEYGHRTEVRSRLLTASSVLIVLSALTRALAPVSPSTYLHHLSYAALTWFIAVLLWMIVFVPKAIRLNTK